MKRIFAIFFLIFIASPLFVFAQRANHYGERDYLSYRIEYLAPLGDTLVSDNGIDFIWDGYIIEHLNKFLPEIYYGHYPLYFSGGVLNFNVVIKNEGQRRYRNLKIETFQEFLNTDGSAGEPIGENNKQFWLVEKLGPGEEIILSGEFNIPSIGESGIDQTHLRIFHGNSSGNEEGQIILEDFQAGLWCPLNY